MIDLNQNGVSLRTLNHVSLLWGSSLLSGVLVFLSQTLIARSFTVQEYGSFATAYRMISLLAPLAGFGLGACWLRVYGKEGCGAKRWIKPSLILACCTTGSSAAVALILGALLGLHQRLGGLAYLLTPLLLFWAASELGRARLQLEGRYGAMAAWELAFSLGCFLVAWVIRESGSSVFLLSAGFSLVGLAVSVFHGLRAIQMPSAKILMAGKTKDEEEHEALSPGILEVAREAMPFALAGLFYLLYHQIGVVMLGWMQGEEFAGIYNVALTVIAAVALLPDAVFQKYLMPKMQHWAEHDKAHFLRVYKLGNGIMLGSGLGLMLAVGFGAPKVLPLVFGNAYLESGRLLFILALTVPLRFLCVGVGCALVTGGHMARKNLYHGVAAMTNVALNLSLIPHFGVYGVAWAAVLTETILLGLFLRGVRKHVLGSDAFQGWNLRLGSLHES